MVRNQDTIIAELKKLLKTQQPMAQNAIITRCTLRTWPILNVEFGPPFPHRRTANEIVLPCARSAAFLWAENSHPGLHSLALSKAEQSTYRFVDPALTTSTSTTAYSFAEALRFHRVNSISSFNSFLGFASEGDLAAIAQDMNFLKSARKSSALMKRPLWGSTEPYKDFWSMLESLNSKLTNLFNDWDIWTSWYDAVVEGRPTSGGKELDFFRATLNSDEDWNKGPAHVNALIKAKEDEIAGSARRRTSSIDLSNNEEFEKWLRTQPREVSLAIAARASLRAFPLIHGEFESESASATQIGATIVLPIVRAMALSLAAAKYPNEANVLRSAAVYASASALDSSKLDHVASAAVRSVAFSAFHAALGVVDDQFHEHSNKAVSYAAFAADPVKADRAAAGRDANFIESNGVAILAAQPLWLLDRPERVMWSYLWATILELDENWDVWTRWYDAVRNGHPTPGGEELDVYRVMLTEADWKEGPKHVNALIKAKEDEIAARVESGLTTTIPDIPAELDGPSWDTDRQTGMLTPVFRQSNQSESEVADMESQRPFLLECAQGLVAAIETSTSNSAMQLLPAAERYRRSIETNSSLISIPEVYAAGVRLRNSHDRIRREVENEGMPDVAINIGEAMDSVIGLHGPFILAAARGREMNARARDDNRTKAQELAYKAKSLELSKALRQSNGLVTESGKNLIAEINSEIATGPHPERSTMLAEASNHNLLVTASSLIALEYSKVVLLDTAAGKLAIGVGTSTANIALTWMMANAALLISFAATSPETLYWLPHFLSWLQAKYEFSRN